MAAGLGVLLEERLKHRSLDISKDRAGPDRLSEPHPHRPRPKGKGRGDYILREARTRPCASVRALHVPALATATGYAGEPA
ncbi:MAG: hypothetical protein HZB55_11950 [Deltaproteobacteria bacterium]|nr:hypothetical protein [Deltaproteobacteria bacterium]